MKMIDGTAAAAGNSGLIKGARHPNLKPFRPGQSGNPRGRPKVTESLKALAKSNAPRAMERLVELMESEDERVALAASLAVLDRAYGKLAVIERDAHEDSPPVVTEVRLIAVTHEEVERQRREGSAS